MPAMNTVSTLRDFFNPPELKMDELKAMNSATRRELAEMCKAEMIRRGSHKPEDFDFSSGTKAA